MSSPQASGSAPISFNSSDRNQQLQQQEQRKKQQQHHQQEELELAQRVEQQEDSSTDDDMDSFQRLSPSSRPRRMSAAVLSSEDESSWTLIDRLEMVSDHAFDDWKKQRSAERTAAKQKQHSPEKVPVKLSSKLQVWVPIELMSVVQSLWARAQPDESVEREGEDFHAHEVRVWSLFLEVIHQTKPNTASSHDSQTLTPASRMYLLRIAFTEFVYALNGNNVHAILADLHKNDESPTEMHRVLQTYSAVLAELRQAGYQSDINAITAASASTSPSGAGSGLFDMAKRGVSALFALFGGQGVNWLQELRTNYKVYVDVRPTIERAIDAMKKQATLLITEKEEESSTSGDSSSDASSAATKGYNELFGYGIDIMEWIEDEDSVPPPTYLSSAPLSYPMIGLTALINYLICIKTWGLTPADVVSYFKGVTGHSQGILSGLVFAASKTEEELIENIISSVQYLFWIGVRLQQAVTFPSFIEAQRTDILKESKKIHGSRNPTPMMVVLHLLPQVVQKYVDMINKKLSDEPNRQLEIALQNGPRAVVVVGHPESLHTLSMLLNEKETRKEDSLDQSRIPHSKRKHEFRLVYLPVSVPFHSQLLKGAVQRVREDVKRLREKGGRLWSLKGEDLAIPLYSTLDGSDLRSSDKGLVDVLIDLQCTEHVNWLRATEKISRRQQGITHVIDFGPGKMSGAVSFTSKNLEGSGVQFVMAGAFQPFRENDLVVADKSVLFDSRLESIPFARDWETEFGPRLVHRTVDNKLIVDTKYTRVMGKPPVMVAGMTPTSASHQIVAATLNAGYHGELAGGGLPTETIFRERVDQLVQSMDEGHGITLNLLYLNPRQWNMQFPLLLKLKKQGYPIEGVCVAAGVPSPEKSAELIESLQRAGIKHIAFKPGSIAAIRLVCQIAEAHPDMNILLQWTGGRAGGHHSFEDFHEPILQTYSLIRSHKNIVLIGGSGFGDAEHSWPYLNGSWSLKFGFQPMPYDAILIASRVMVAKEANTSLEAKKLLVETPGIESEEEWENSYHTSAGGIITVKSELGEPIHKVRTRGLEVWKDFDDQFFSLPREKMIQKITEKKQYIIKRLNADFQKVYFGRTLSGQVVDLPEMTYYEVAHRMVSLMYIQPTEQRPEGRWIDKGFFDRVLDFARHTEERFIIKRSGEHASKSKHVSALPPASLLKEKPFEWVDKVFKETYSDAAVQLLSTEDVDYFIQLCKSRIGKPVNFVPVIDDNLQFWFKKDSLWQSEDLDAVQDRDVGRVVILQGPLAVRYCTKVNEPVADILNGIHDGWMEIMRKANPTQQYPKIEYLSPPVPERITSAFGAIERAVSVSVDTETEANKSGDKTAAPITVSRVTIRLPREKSQLPDRVAWYEWLCAGKNSWWRALLTSPHIVQGKKYIINPFIRLLEPAVGQRYEIRSVRTPNQTSWHENVSEISLFDDMVGQSANGSATALVTAPLKHKPVLRIKCSDDRRGFAATIYHPIPVSSSATSSLRWEMIPLTLHYRYYANRASAPISQITEGFNDAVKQFYGRLWFSSADEVSKEVDTKQPLTATFTNVFDLKKSAIEFFSVAIGRTLASDGKLLQAPTDLAIVAAWESLIKSLFLKQIDGNLLHLVHLNNGFRKLDSDQRVFGEGDTIVTNMEITKMHKTVSGLQIGVVGQLKKQNQQDALIEVRSEFLFRGNEASVLSHSTGVPLTADASEMMFEKSKDTHTLEVKSKELLAILQSKSWIHWRTEADKTSLKMGERLVFKFSSLEIEHHTIPKIDTRDERDFDIDDNRSKNQSNVRKQVKIEGIIYKLSGPSSFVPTLASLESRGDDLEREMMDAVAQIAYERDNVKGNVVRAFVQRFGKPLEHAVFFENGGYQLLNVPDRTIVPAESVTYALASGDLNPIHTNRYFSIFADLPHDTITHGMWTSANARRVIESFVAKNRPERVVDFHTEFVGMVRPRDQISTSVRHVGMRNGRMLVEIETTTDRGELVLKGSADVKGPKTCYVFTGQGSVSVGMGLDLYASSPIAKNIWDAADKYFQEAYGFSILQLVKENPKEITIFFGGRRGRNIKKNYQRLTCQVQEEVELPATEDKKPQRAIRTREKPLFPDITDTTSSYTFKHPEGLLFATQFSQPALVLVELSAFEDMRERGLIPSDDCIFAGHSLGEYAALASVAKVLTIESLVDIVFLRGMTMQNSVIRDKDGHSQYSMVAVNPQRVHPFLFRDVHLDEIISIICQKNDQLLQVVNYNVEHYQYVVAGENGNLYTLGLVIDEIHQRLKKLTQGAALGTGTGASTARELASKIKIDRALVEQLVESAIRETEENVRDPVTRRIVLKRGVATIPLPGIDVPFHSRFLKDGVPAFRQILLQRMTSQQINPSILVGRYIPNVTAVPFSLDRSYVESLRDQTQSPVLDEVLSAFDDYRRRPQQLAFNILVELLAYQFASPVRWIETQKVIFAQFGVERLIEVGPAPTLSQMAKTTLAMGNYSPLIKHENLWYNRDRDVIYYNKEDAPAPPPAVVPVEAVAPTTPKSGTAPPPAATPTPATTPTPAPSLPTPPASSAPVVDEKPTALESLLTLLSIKLQKDIDTIPASSSVKSLTGGKSALQNEIVGDVQKEFEKEPEGAAEMEITALAAKLADGPDGKHKLGAYLSGQIAKLVSGKMPGGFPLSSVKGYLAGRYALGEGRIEGVLLRGLAAEPKARLATEDEAKKWLDSVVADYARAKGIALFDTAGAAGSGDGGSSGKVIDAALLDKLEERSKSLVRDQMKAFFKYLSENPLDKEGKVKLFEQLLKEKADELSTWINEHGTEYGNGIKPIFDAKKERRYDSAWNWTRQDCLVLYYDYACGRARNWNNDIRERLYRIKNRATPNAYDMTEWAKKKAVVDGHPEIVSFINILGEILQREIVNYPIYRELSIPMAPKLEVDCKGIIQYKEVPRPGVKDMTAYVSEMERGAAIGAPADEVATATSAEDGQAQMQLLLQQLRTQKVDPSIIASMEKLVKDNEEKKKAEEEERRKKFIQPFIFLRGRAEEDPSHRTYEPKLTQKYMNVLREMATQGVTFHDKTILITGCGRDSIGLEIVKAMLRGGAKIYATTSRFSSSGSSFYHQLFDQHGTKTSQLIILPFNQSSQQDVNSLVDYIYDKEGADIDYIIPFAAIPEGGRDIGALDGKTELAHRLMLTNTIRLIGAVKNKKEARSIVTRPAHVLLPLSPNHGVFGFDGLYAESKLGLEALLNKWHAEGWSGYLSLAGAVIGWTRGTGLMKGNNLLAVGIEQLGVRTFTTQEICFNCVGLLHPKMVAEAQKEPVLADLSGGLLKIKDLGSVLNDLRASMNEDASVRKAVYADQQKDKELETAETASNGQARAIRPRANINVEFPPLPSKERLEQLMHIKGMVDMERIVVVTGFGEVGPWGSARTRWEMEAYGEFSIEGCIELAWMMGLIRYHNDDRHSGWVDAKTGEPVKDDEIKSRYEKTILDNTGIRIIEPSLFEGYEPSKKMFLHQVAINEDMGPLEVSSEEEALAFKRQHGDAVQIIEKEGGIFQVLIKRGSVLYIPKALKFNRFVAGQVPTTWDPSIFGLPEDIVKQVDPVTLYTLVSTAEALVSAGVTDPYEFYEYVHVSQVGNTIGGGFGGMKSVRQMHRDVLLEQPVKGDTLQEMFINTVAAYVNMLLLSSSGPIKTPVGACATAVGSIEIGVETIQSGKAKIVVVGGYDDFSEEGSYGFASMKATSNSEAEMEAGRPPSEMSRPATSTRGGFMEAQGAGVEILMSADLAIKMGVPIYGIITHVATATDKNGRSVPAPGKGLLVTARQQNALLSSPMLDISYRRKHLEAELAKIDEWYKNELEFLTQWIKDQTSRNGLSEDQEKTMTAEQLETLDIKVQHKRSMAYSVWGNEFYRNDPYISPLAGGLAVFGLNIDDVEVASFHGTGTAANDINESQLLQKQLEHLGRTTGNCILSIFQKYLTGHPKGAAAAWMLNGLLQSMMTGIVPGNRNADNIDKELEACDHIVFLNRSLHTYGYKAGLLKSFGFGQVGGEILVIHPDYILAQLSSEELEAYTQRRQRRYNMAYRHWHDSLTHRKSFVMIKDRAPYTYGEEQKVYLNPKARAKFDGISWSFPETDRRKLYAQKGSSPAAAIPPSSPTKSGTGRHSPRKTSARTNLEVTLREMGEGLRAPSDRGIGVDTQLISEIEVSISNSTNFLSRNYTPEEINYCRSTSDPAASFAGRWAAKEAVVKAISSCDDNERSRELWEGGGAALKDIEIVRGPSGAPKVVLHGHAQTVASVLGVGSIKVTISHSGEYAIAQAIAQ